VCFCVQALMASEDKALKALQEGIDADAQPAALLEELLKRHTGGEELKEACDAVLQKFPESEAMLNCKQTIHSTANSALLLSSFSTPAPKAKAAAAASAKKSQLDADGSLHSMGTKKEPNSPVKEPYVTRKATY